MSASAESVERPRACPAGETILGFAETDPFAFYERARALGSPVWDEGAKAWLVLDFEQCAAAERDESNFANAYVFADDIVKEIKGGGANITLSRDDEHIRLRRFHLKLLSPASVERFREPFIKPIIDQAADRLIGRDRADLAEDYASQIPPRVICSLLGMPYEDDGMMARILFLNEEIVNFIASGYRDMELRDRALAASRELNEMLLPYVRARRDNPKEDFISRVWQEAPEAGITLDEQGVLGLCRELYFAGSDTTVHGIANSLHLLLSSEETMARVRADRGKALAALIEEGLRLFNVVQFRHRFCMQDAKVGDVTVKKGEMIILVHAAANRDPAKFACPHEADLDRRSPTDHLAFAKGTRSCVGSQLARVEMREAVSALLDRFERIEPDRDAAPPHFRALYMRSMGPLNVRLHG
jgi:cytochrome P450